MISTLQSRSSADARSGRASSKSGDLATSILRFVAILGFFLLYPGYFLYHIMVYSGRIPPIAAGFYGYAIVFVAAMSVIPFLSSSRFVFLSKIYMIFSFFIVYSIFWVSYFGYISPSMVTMEEVNIQMIVALISWFALFSIGSFLYLEGLFAKISSISVWMAISLITLYYAIASGSVSVDLTGIYGVSEDASSYQGFSRSFLFLSILTYCLIKKDVVRWAVAVASVFVLFLLTSRTEFVAFIFSVSLIEVLHPKRRSIGIIFILLIAVSFGFLVSDYFDVLRGSRISNLVSLDSDKSWIERQWLTQFALQQIQDSPITGLYGGHVHAGSPGSYAHNALSAWVNLGFVGFALYMLLNIVSAFHATRAFLRDQADVIAKMAFMVTTSVLLLCIFSKSMFWGEAALGWGLAANVALASRAKGARAALRPRGASGANVDRRWQRIDF